MLFSKIFIEFPVYGQIHRGLGGVIAFDNKCGVNAQFQYYKVHKLFM